MHAGAVRNCKKLAVNLFKSQEISFKVQNGEFSKDGFMSVAGMAAGDDKDKLKAAEEIADTCKTVKHEHRCEQAILIGKCMEEEAKKKNLTAERR